MGKEPQEPSNDYHYRYCSDGFNFLLETDYQGETINSLGDSFCQAEE